MTERVTDQDEEPCVMFDVGVRLALSIRVRRVEGLLGCLPGSGLVDGFIHHAWRHLRHRSCRSRVLSSPNFDFALRNAQLNPARGISRQPYGMKT